MTRFAASTPEGRLGLVADAIAAHRERESLFCTLEADDLPPDASEPAPDDDSPGQATSAWIQYSAAEQQLNLDCTDAEYDRITDVLANASEFTVDEQSSPEDADGRNLRITAYADDERIADVVDRLFIAGFGYDEDVRLWATEI